jgi:hypothetical protein
MRHDRDAENAGPKITYGAVAPAWPGSQQQGNSPPALPEPTPRPRPEPDHPKVDFYRPTRPPCFSGASSDDNNLPAIASASRYR